MKYIQVTKSEDETEHMLDHPRQMGFGYGDIRQMQKLFKAPLLGDETTWKDSLLGMLGNQDFNVISAFMTFGLQNYDKHLDQTKADELIQAFLDTEGNEVSDLVKLIRRALEAGNYVPQKKTQTANAKVEGTPGRGGPLVSI